MYIKLNLNSLYMILLISREVQKIAILGLNVYDKLILGWSKPSCRLDLHVHNQSDSRHSLSNYDNCWKFAKNETQHWSHQVWWRILSDTLLLSADQTLFNLQSMDKLQLWMHLLIMTVNIAVRCSAAKDHMRNQFLPDDSIDASAVPAEVQNTAMMKTPGNQLLLRIYDNLRNGFGLETSALVHSERLRHADTIRSIATSGKRHF